MEIKLDILYVFIPHMIYRYVDEVLDVFLLIVNKCNDLDGIFANNINPIMVAAQMIEINQEIKRMFPLSRIRIDQFEGPLIQYLIELLDRLYLP
jgi:hypothetical protein